MQQEVIIKKLEKLETVMEHDLPELKSQQEAIRVEVSEAMKASTKHGNTRVEKDADTLSAAGPPHPPQPRVPAPARPTTKAATVGPAPPATKPFLERDNLLLVGDSILHNANFKVIENSTGTNVHTTKAYAADYDLKSLFQTRILCMWQEIKPGRKNSNMWYFNLPLFI